MVLSHMVDHNLKDIPGRLNYLYSPIADAPSTSVKTIHTASLIVTPYLES